MLRAQLQSAQQLAAAKDREAAEAAKAKAVADTARREAETAAGEASTAAAAATAAAGDLAARERSAGELRLRWESQLRRVGQIRSQLEAQQAHAERPAAGTARTLSAQVDAQQMEIARLQSRVEELEAEGSGRGQRSCPGRTDAATHQVTFRDMRVNGFRADAFSLSMLRRAIEEGGCSFEALPVINALLLAMHTRGEPEPRMLFNSQLVRQAFLRLGVYDGNQTRASNRRRAKCWAWALGADEGNKGRGMDMIAIVTWDEEIDKPQIQVIAAAEVHDKSGHGLAALLERARENAGLHPEGLTHLSSDGASACASDQVGETVLFQRRQQEASSADPTALCHSAARTLCAIHGMAIEENAGIEAAFPMHLLWAFLASRPSSTKEGIAIRSGHHCTQPLHAELVWRGRSAYDGSARASLYIYNTHARARRWTSSARCSSRRSSSSGAWSRLSVVGRVTIPSEITSRGQPDGENPKRAHDSARHL